MKRLAALLTLAVLALAPAQASAHVFLRDDTGSSGLVLHVSPDDDPVAGEKATMFFDLQGSGRTYDFILTVTTPDDERIEVPVARMGDASVRADFVFAVRGQYGLELVATDRETSGAPLRFASSLAVTRGTGGTSAGAERHTWAEITLVMAGTVLVVVMALLVVRWRVVRAFSKW